MLRKIFKETNSREFFTPLESLPKSEEKRLPKENGESITSTLECRHLSAVEHMIE
jgi:hypothetical protein